MDNNKKKSENNSVQKELYNSYGAISPGNYQRTK